MSTLPTKMSNWQGRDDKKAEKLFWYFICIISSISLTKKLKNMMDRFIKNYVDTAMSLFDDTCKRVVSKVENTESGAKIILVVPGLDKDDLKITTEDDRLTVSGVNKENSETKVLPNFKESFYVGREIDMNNISANLKNGVLLINLQKKKGLAGKQIIID